MNGNSTPVAAYIGSTNHFSTQADSLVDRDIATALSLKALQRQPQSDVISGNSLSYLLF